MNAEVAMSSFWWACEYACHSSYSAWVTGWAKGTSISTPPVSSSTMTVRPTWPTVMAVKPVLPVPPLLRAGFDAPSSAAGGVTPKVAQIGSAMPYQAPGIGTVLQTSASPPPQTRVLVSTLLAGLWR